MSAVSTRRRYSCLNHMVPVHGLACLLFLLTAYHTSSSMPPQRSNRQCARACAPTFRSNAGAFLLHCGTQRPRVAAPQETLGCSEVHTVCEARRALAACGSTTLCNLRPSPPRLPARLLSSGTEMLVPMSARRCAPAYSPSVSIKQQSLTQIALDISRIGAVPLPIVEMFTATLRVS